MNRKAVLYRMHNNEHICPFGLRSKDLLEKKAIKLRIVFWLREMK